MNYGYNPYQRQQQYQYGIPTASFAQGPYGTAFEDLAKYRESQDALSEQIGRMRGAGMSEMEIDKFVSEHGPSFMSNPRGYLMDKTAEGIASGASAVGGALKDLGSSL